MQGWEKHWFGPVAAIRPYLFQKCFTLMIAFDLLVLMVERGARYGADGMPFNVAHFRWIDAIHSLLLPSGIPTANYYVCIVTITSFLCFFLFFAGHRPWLMALVCGLFTYCWSMSRLDSYLHHYLLSLIMLCMVFFPRVSAVDLKVWLEESNRGSAAKVKRGGDHGNAWAGWIGAVLLVLAFVYRLLLSDGVGLGDQGRWAAMFVSFGLVAAVVWKGSRSVPARTEPLVSAWSFRMLLTTVGVIYMYAAIAKMDAEWCGGHTLKTVGTTESVLQPVARLVGAIGVAPDTFWSMLATFVIPLELTLGAIYILSVKQDEPGRIWLPRISLLGWLLAVGLHLNNEMMNLIIQWFGYYMLLLATLLLLPSRILLVAGLAFIEPECWVRDRVTRVLDSEKGQSLLWAGATVCLTLITAFGFASLSMIPGMMLAALVLMACLVVFLAVAIAFGWNRSSILVAGTSSVVFVAMTCAVLQSSMQFDYYDLAGKTFMSQGRLREATQSMEAATAFRAPSKPASAELLTNLAICYVRELRQQASGLSEDNLLSAARRIEATFRQACTDDPRQFLAHYSLGNFLASQNRIAEAQQQFRAALAIKSDFSDAYVNLGNTYEFEERFEEAVQCYETAARIEPYAQDIQQLLTRAKARLAGTSE